MGIKKLFSKKEKVKNEATLKSALRILHMLSQKLEHLDMLWKSTALKEDIVMSVRKDIVDYNRTISSLVMILNRISSDYKDGKENGFVKNVVKPIQSLTLKEDFASNKVDNNFALIDMVKKEIESMLNPEKKKKVTDRKKAV